MEAAFRFDDEVADDTASGIVKIDRYRCGDADKGFHRGLHIGDHQGDVLVDGDADQFFFIVLIALAVLVLQVDTDVVIAVFCIIAGF